MATAHVLVATREPDLLDILPWCVRLRPQRGCVRTAHLVHRNSVTPMTNMWVEYHVVEIMAVQRVKRVQPAQVLGDAERTNRIPDADEVYRDRFGPLRIEGEV